MKLLFSATTPAEVRDLRQRLVKAGIRCQVRRNRLARGVFGIPSYPELWITRDIDSLAALKLLGAQRLGRMTAIFPKT